MERKESIPHTPTNNLNQYYEYRVYDKNIGRGYGEEMCSISEYAPCPIVVMSRHQGFQWNEELFVNAYRRSAGYECHKSPSLQDRDQQLTSCSTIKRQEARRLSDDVLTATTEVIDIHLTDEDKDVWP